jgi:hypothetical protein
MSSSSFFPEIFLSILGSIVTASPLILVCIVGGLAISKRWSQLGKAARPAMVGIVLLLLITIWSPAVQTLIIRTMNRQQIASMSFILTLCSHIGVAIAVGLLILSILLGRAKEGEATAVPGVRSSDSGNR